VRAQAFVTRLTFVLSEAALSDEAPLGLYAAGSFTAAMTGARGNLPPEDPG